MMKYKVLSMDYFNEFKCIGNKCEDHCCKGWKITVDKKTYSKYKKLKPSNFKEKIHDNINRNRKAQSDYDYAKINLVDGQCPMLSKESLCEVYSNIGAENMCYTCRTYPRNYTKVDDVLQQSLTVSCIEVARNLLLRKDSIEFNFDIKEIIEEMNIGKVVVTKGKKINQRYFNEIRQFSIGLIQNRRFSIENRLAILGLFINKISNSKEDVIINTIGEFNNAINSGIYNDLIERLIKEDKFDAQLEFMMGIYKIILSKTIVNKRYINNFDNIVNSLKLDSGDEKKIKSGYEKSLNDNYRKFMFEHQHIYENYLVNYMFKNMFPCNGNTLLDSYLNLTIQFSILKMNLIGICGYYKEEMDIEKVLNLIQSYAAVTEHDQFLANKISNYLKENNLNTLAHMLIIMGK